MFDEETAAEEAKKAKEAKKAEEKRAKARRRARGEEWPAMPLPGLFAAAARRLAG